MNCDNGNYNDQIIAGENRGLHSTADSFPVEKEMRRKRLNNHEIYGTGSRNQATLLNIIQYWSYIVPCFTVYYSLYDAPFYTQCL